MIQDFTAVADNLAVFGDRSIDVFKGLAAQAKATGMEVSSLVALAESFNQFDKAADSASKLNAVLGTQLSTLQLYQWIMMIGYHTLDKKCSNLLETLVPLINILKCTWLKPWA